MEKEKDTISKKYFLLLIFFTLFIYSTATAQSPISFFPCQVGNLWQYRLSTGHLMWTEIIDTVYSDTNGIVFVGYTNINHDAYTPYISKGWYMIKDSIYVYRVPLPTHYPNAYFLYKLDAQLNDSWIVTIVDSTERNVAQIYSISNGLVFGKEVIVKDIRYGISVTGFNDTLWWDFRTLAEGFGMIEAQLEPMAPVYLTGAIIDGVQYGYIVGVEEIVNKPTEFMLHQNFPNPFNPETVISYQLSVNSAVKLRVYDLLGREIATLVDKTKQPGSYTIQFDASNFPSGTYFYQLQTKGGVLTKKMTLIK